MEICLKPLEVGSVIECNLHRYSNGTKDDYGEVSFLSLVGERNLIKCSLIMVKAEAPPTNFLYILRLELTVAVVSIKVSK